MLLVSAADKLDNARGILADYRLLEETLWTRFNGGNEGTLWCYPSLFETFREFGVTSLVAELSEVVEEIERLASLRGRRQGRGPPFKTAFSGRTSSQNRQRENKRGCAGACRGVRLDSPAAVFHRGAHAAGRARGRSHC